MSPRRKKGRVGNTVRARAPRPRARTADAPTCNVSNRTEREIRIFAELSLAVPGTRRFRVMDLNLLRTGRFIHTENSPSHFDNRSIPVPAYHIVAYRRRRPANERLTRRVKYRRFYTFYLGGWAGTGERRADAPRDVRGAGVPGPAVPALVPASRSRACAGRNHATPSEPARLPSARAHGPTSMPSHTSTSRSPLRVSLS